MLTKMTEILCDNAKTRDFFLVLPLSEISILKAMCDNVEML